MRRRPSLALSSRARSSRRPIREEVASRQALTTEAIELLDTAEEPPLDGIHDVRERAALAARGGVLTAGTLREVADTVGGALRVRASLDGQEGAPLLREVAAAIDTGLAPLVKSIDRAVEPDGSDLKDNASPRLRKLRVELRTGRQRVAEKLEQLVRKTGVREHLQEDFVTQRAGRPVLAVKASSRSSVPGIVHDSSDSGQTLFVEPFDVVELNNRQSEAAGAEREEAERILRELSSAVGERADALALLVDATARVDLALALGAVSRGWRGAPVEVSGEVRLVGARHPLLDPATAVPIDLELGDLRALVISGPNTGGKTVALKTLGLAALLHQSGLRPPAATAALPVFDEVLADIGDPQSIEMSLSTFSGHVANLVSILRSARGRSLVLVDELASGTDPVEGSALAQALLARLAQQARLTVVTTHYPELKEWASATDGVANAATGFDPETHEPLYRVALGRPGVSHALRIAERLGLDGDDRRRREGSRRAGAAAHRGAARGGGRSGAGCRRRSAPRRGASTPKQPPSPSRPASARRRSKRRSRPSKRRQRASASAQRPKHIVSSRARARSCRRCARRSAPRAGATGSRDVRHPLPRGSATVVLAPLPSGQNARSVRSGHSTSRRRLPGRSPRAIPSRHRRSVSTGRSPRSKGMRPRSSDRRGTGSASRSRGFVPPVGGRRSPSRRCASSPRHAATSRTRSTCADSVRRKRAKPFGRSSTTPRWPAFRLCASSTAAARERSAPRSARS